MSIHNIICLESEWLYSRQQEKDNRFNLKTQPILEWLKAYHACEVIHRHVLTRTDLEYYLDYFSSNRQKYRKYNIIYIASHGNSHAISLEGDDGLIDLSELVSMTSNSKFFNEKIVHFSCCKTLLNKEKAECFKRESGARLVCGYTKSVDPMKSSIADMALFNDIMYLKNVGHILNRERSKFWKTYGTLLDELGFVVY